MGSYDGVHACTMHTRAQMHTHVHIRMATLMQHTHMQVATGSPQLLLTPAIAFTVAFMLLFSVVIALFKVSVPHLRCLDWVQPCCCCCCCCPQW